MYNLEGIFYLHVHDLYDFKSYFLEALGEKI